MEREPPPRPTDETADLVAWLGRLAADPAGLAAAPAAALAAAWAEYATARVALPADEQPPPEYRLGQPQARRVAEWREADHPSLRDAFVRMLEIVWEARRANASKSLVF